MTRFRTRVLLAAAASALAAALIAAPAYAHDALAGSSPDEGENLATAPTEIVLNYSANVIEGSASVAIIDTHCTDWTGGEPVVDATDVIIPVTAHMPDGAYEVRWRVASSDGHPIDGRIAFTVDDADASPVPDCTPGSTASAEPTSTTAAEPTDELDCEQTCAETGAATDTGSEPDVDWVRTGLIGLGGAVAVLVAVVVFRKMRNRKASGEHDGEDL